MTIPTILFLTAMHAVVADQADVKALFESGSHQQLIDATASAGPEVAGDPAVLYLKALSHEKLSQSDAAVRTYEQITAGRGEQDAWRYVGEAGRLLVRGQTKPALAAATRAVELNGSLAEAHYQRGLVLGHANNFAGAAKAFERAAHINPAFAYAHYYAGISFYRAKRIDLMASHFEAFLRLAPNAPERGEVESIMRTVRGRR